VGRGCGGGRVAENEKGGEWVALEERIKPRRVSGEVN